MKTYHFRPVKQIPALLFSVLSLLIAFTLRAEENYEPSIQLHKTVRAGMFPDDSISQTELRYDANSVPHDALEMALHQHLWLFIAVTTAILLLLAALLWYAVRTARRLGREKIYLSMTLESVNDGLISTDTNGTVQWINPAAGRMTGIGRADAAGRPIEEVFKAVDPQDGTPLESLARKVLLTGAPVEFAENTALLTPDGKTDCRIECGASPIRGETGRITGALIVFRDITDACRRQEEMKAEIFHWNAVSKIASIYRFRFHFKTRQVTGNVPDDIWPISNGIAVPAEEWIYPEDLAVWQESHMHLISGEKRQLIVNYRVVNNGKMRYFREYMERESNSNDLISGIVQDISELMREQKKREAIFHLWDLVANAIPAILFVKDADNDFRYIYANNKLCALLNRPLEQLIGHAEHEFINEADAARIRLSDQEMMNSDKQMECYERLRDASGIDHHYHSIKIPSVNEFGHRIMIQMTSDVTELQELSEVRKIVSNAFEKLFFTENLESGIRGILRHICEFVGFTRGYVCCVDDEKNIVKLFATYIPEGETPLFDDKKFAIVEVTNQAWYRNIVESKQGDVLECDFNKKEDCEKARRLFPLVLARKEQFDIRGAHVQYLAVNGKPWGYVGFLTEHANPKTLSENEKNLLKMAAGIIELAVTRKRTFIHLQDAMDEARAAAVAKSQFLATMSHEIRTPLNAVIGFADLLQDPRLDSATHNEYLKNISDAGNVLLSLINDILDLSKLSADKMKFVPAGTSIGKLVEEMEICFHPRCEAKKLRFVRDVPPDFPSVWVDASRIRQLLLNLIGNAVKFTDSGFIAVKAEFTKKNAETGTLVISVADTGIGISESDQKQLFQPFSQAKAILGTAAANKGTGLGLSICKKMLECMDGRLSVVSAVGKGSTFTAELHDVKYRDAAPEETEVAQEETETVRKDFSHVSALIVDDVPMNLLVLKAILKKLGIEAETANNAKNALEKLAEHRFDFVLTDLWMPEMNGVELANGIRRNMKENAPKIAVVTADVEGRDQFDYSAFDAVLTKPVTARALQRFFEKA